MAFYQDIANDIYYVSSHLVDIQEDAPDTPPTNDPDVETQVTDGFSGVSLYLSH